MIFFFLIGHKIGVNTIIQEDIDGWLTTVSLNFLPKRLAKFYLLTSPFTTEWLVLILIILKSRYSEERITLDV